MTTVEYLDAVMSKFGLTSDYGLAKLFGYSTQRISNYRRGVSHMDTMTAVKVADLLELDRMAVIADTNLERATKDRDRAFWEGVARDVTAVLAMLSIALGALLGNPDVARADSLNDTTTVYYVKCRFRHLLRLLKSLVDLADSLSFC